MALMIIHCLGIQRHIEDLFYGDCAGSWIYTFLYLVTLPGSYGSCYREAILMTLNYWTNVTVHFGTQHLWVFLITHLNK